MNLTASDVSFSRKMIEETSLLNDSSLTNVTTQLHHMISQNAKAEMESIIGGKLHGQELVNYVVQKMNTNEECFSTPELQEECKG
jgi:pyrimidine operon attenuation protein/uracil phosphoribosyltransferase